MSTTQHPWWAMVPRAEWQQATNTHKFDNVTAPVRAALRYVEEAQAADEARSVGMRTVTYR